MTITGYAASPVADGWMQGKAAAPLFSMRRGASDALVAGGCV